MTATVESNTRAEAGDRRGQVDVVDVRTWCLDCYDRREPWVLRALGELGVEFRHTVLVEKDVCRSCKASLALGLHAIVVTIPMRNPSPVPDMVPP